MGASVPRTLGSLVLAVLLYAAPAAAHPISFSFLDLRIGNDGMSGTLTVHLFDVAHELSVEPPERLLEAGVVADRAATLEALLASRLSLDANGEPLRITWGPFELVPSDQALRLPFTLTSGRGSTRVEPGSGQGQTGVRPGSDRGQTRVRPPILRLEAGLLFPYDPKHQTFVNVYEDSALRQQVILDASRASFEYFSGSPRGTLAVVRRFVAAGIHHILIGPDHILFLIGLLLLGGSIRRLAMVVTSFTLAHSITLSIAALNVLSPSARVVEPLIALSIVYVGVDNLMVRGGRDVRGWIAFGFGLVHGFGFASVLREMDLPSRALGWSLFSFNLGVEVGQLLIVVVVASALAALRHRSEAAGRRLAFAGSLVVMVAGTFWFVQRVFFVGGSL